MATSKLFRIDAQFENFLRRRFRFTTPLMFISGEPLERMLEWCEEEFGAAALVRRLDSPWFVGTDGCCSRHYRVTLDGSWIVDVPHRQACFESLWQLRDFDAVQRAMCASYEAMPSRRLPSDERFSPILRLRHVSVTLP